MQTVLVTGSAGFIGYHLSQRLLDEGFRVVGFDGMTDYYDVRLKERRHQMLLQNQHFSCEIGMLEDFDTLQALCNQEKTLNVLLMLFKFICGNYGSMTSRDL